MKTSSSPIKAVYTLYQLFWEGWQRQTRGLPEEWDAEIDKAIAFFDGGADQSSIITELLELIGDERLQGAARKAGMFE